MKATILPRVPVFLALATLAFAAGLNIAAANQMLKSAAWMIPYLWGLSGILFIIAASLAFVSNRESKKEKLRKKEKLKNDIVRLLIQQGFLTAENIASCLHQTPTTVNSLIDELVNEERVIRRGLQIVAKQWSSTSSSV